MNPDEVPFSAAPSPNGHAPAVTGQIPKRPYQNDVQLSVIGFGGIVVVGHEQAEANAIVAQSIERGVNYFDVAPSYANGEAEEKLGIALQPYRDSVFLACKTGRRDAAGAREELEQSLRRLHTEYFDLYQFHAVTTLDDVEKIFDRGGALEVFLRARDESRVRFLGFSAHSEEAALAMMDRFDFDSILFPINYVCYAQGNFGPAVVRRAQEKGVARLALKALAHTPWPKEGERSHPKCWYRPLDDRAAARQALRFTLSENITAAIPPGDIRIFRMALDLAAEFEPLSDDERRALLDDTEALRPIFQTR